MFIQGWGMTETNPLATLGKMIAKSEHTSWSVDKQFENVVKAGLLLPGLKMSTSLCPTTLLPSAPLPRPYAVLLSHFTVEHGLEIVDVDDFSKDLPNDGIAQGELLLQGPWITGAYYRVSKKKIHSMSFPTKTNVCF